MLRFSELIKKILYLKKIVFSTDIFKTFLTEFPLELCD
jgi:hypothetical protein